MTAALADDIGELVLRIAESVDELTIARRLLDGIEVGPLDVLDDPELEDLLVRELTYDTRNRMEADPLRRPPTPFAGDDLVSTDEAIRPDDDGLHQPLLANRLRQLGQVLLLELAPREIGRASCRESGENSLKR